MLAPCPLSTLRQTPQARPIDGNIGDCGTGCCVYYVPVAAVSAVSRSLLDAQAADHVKMQGPAQLLLMSKWKMTAVTFVDIDNLVGHNPA